jgi:hypothetical protein
MKNCKSVISLAVATVALACAVNTAQSAPIPQTVDQSGSSDNWNDAIWGTPAAAPTAANDYTTPSGFVVRTGSSSGSNSTFAGDSLTLQGTGQLRAKRPSTADFILTGGGELQAAGSSAEVRGTLLVAAGDNGTLYATSSYDLPVVAAISGSGTLNATGLAGVVISNASNTFSGTWAVSSGELTGSAAGALGAADFLVNDGGVLDIQYSYLGASGSNLAINTGGLFNLDDGTAHVFQSVTVGGAALAPGTYFYATLAPAQQAYFSSGALGTGSITVVPEPGTMGLLLLGGLGVLGTFRRPRLQS